MATTVFLAQENADNNEGRGSMVTIAAFTHPEDAEKAASGRGVMGAGDGIVVPLLVYDSFAEYVAAHTEEVRRRALKKLSPEERRVLGLE